MPSHVFYRGSSESSGRVKADRAGDAGPAGTAPLGAVAGPGEQLEPRGPASLHISKLRGISVDTRNRLKRQGITYASQLLERAGRATDRQRIAARTGITEPELLRLTRRADLARIKGVGAIFADMLELIGIHGVGDLAGRDAAALHAELQGLNAAERFARRAPTPDEVTDWIRQARAAAELLDPEAPDAPQVERAPRQMAAR